MLPCRNMMKTAIITRISCLETGHGGRQYVCHNFTYVFYSYEYIPFQDQIAEDPNTHGATFVPIILGSDKTTVSVGTGNNEYYPLYASIGNIHNNVRRAHCNGVVLVGFLSVPKSICPLYYMI